MIQNKRCTINRSEVSEARPLFEVIEETLGSSALRWYVAEITEEEIVVEVTTHAEETVKPFKPAERPYYAGKSVVLSVIPTGIGCSIGGYAGDASPVTNLLALTADYLITHPNSVNASNFIGLNNDKIVYTDGYCIDLFCKGLVDLYIPHSNKVGLVIEKAESSKLDAVFNIINTVRAVHGVNITDYVITEKPIGGHCIENRSGAFVGTIDNPHVVLEACEKLIRNGVNAIALTSNIQDLSYENYVKHFDGEYPNPVGGVEAIISYLVTRQFQVPSAHAPMSNLRELNLKYNIVDARGAGEFSSASGLACILIGLHRAPQIRPDFNYRAIDMISLNNLTAVVMPFNSLGGVPAIYAQKYNIPVIAVQENHTILNVTQEKLRLNNVIKARSYAEAAGILLALRRGINLESISRPLKTLRFSDCNLAENEWSAAAGISAV